MTSVAYAGTRVIEIAAGLSAGVAGRFFSDLGAEVVRVEAPDRLPEDSAERAAQTWMRARKRVLSLPDGRSPSMADIESLLTGADLVISDLSPRQWAESFPSPDAIVEAHPGVVLLDITRFGRVGPYADYLGPDLVTLALSGYLFVSGLNDREPLRQGADFVDLVTAVNAAGGAMAALHHARRTGQGQVVEVSTLRTMLGTAMSFPTSYTFQGTVRRRSSSRTVSVGTVVPCKDGHALINTFRTPSDLFYVLLADERLLDEKFADFNGRAANDKELAQVMKDAAATKTMRELFEGGQELRMQNAMVQAPSQTPSDPQHLVRHFFAPLPLAGGSAVQAPIPPVVPIDARDEHAHARGEQIASATAGTWRAERVEPTAAVTPTRRAMEGLKVVELTFAWAGPFMGRILTDHGAQVVKVESSKYFDPTRGLDLVDLSFGENGRWLDRSTSYVIANPDKYHLGMELTDPVGREVLLDLVRWADVLIENFTPRVLPNLGLGWDLFRSVNPSLVMISATGFGHQGPYRDYGAWGWGLECQAGITYTTGYEGDPDPFPVTPTIPDPLSATTGAAAILAALEERRRTGRGQWIDLSQYECATFATLIDVLRAGETGTDRPRVGNRHAWKAPQGVYSSEGADAWVAVAVETDEQWLRLCAAIDRPDLGGDEQLRTHRGRYVRHGRLDDEISAWTRQRTKHEAMHVLQHAGVPAGAVQHAKDLYDDPQIRAMEYFRAAWGQELGLRIFPGPWYGMQTTPGDIRRGTSNFGEDNARVLRELLGYDDDKIEELLSTDTFSDVPRGMEQPATLGLPIATLLERGTILSWDDDYRGLPPEVAERNQRWRREQGLPEVRLDGRA